MKKFALAALFALGASSASAVELTVFGKVIEVFTHEAHSGPLVRFDAARMVPTAGICPRNEYYSLPLTHKFYSQNYQMLLAAKLSDKTIYITVDNPGNCVEGFNRIKHLSIGD